MAFNQAPRGPRVDRHKELRHAVVQFMQEMVSCYQNDEVGSGGLAYVGKTCANPGSEYHPDLCTRSCIYFATGSCVSGNKCKFCHMPHPKREGLDKFLRNCVETLPSAVLFSIVVPVLRERFMAARFRQVERFKAAVEAYPIEVKSLPDVPRLRRSLRAATMKVLLLMLRKSSERSSSGSFERELASTLGALLKEMRAENEASAENIFIPTEEFWL